MTSSRTPSLASPGWFRTQGDELVVQVPSDGVDPSWLACPLEELGGVERAGVSTLRVRAPGAMALGHCGRCLPSRGSCSGSTHHSGNLRLRDCPRTCTSCSCLREQRRPAVRRSGGATQRYRASGCARAGARARPARVRDASRGGRSAAAAVRAGRAKIRAARCSKCSRSRAAARLRSWPLSTF